MSLTCMFPSPYVLQKCSLVAMFQSLCSPEMFPSPYVPQKCSPTTMFQSLCPPIPMFPRNVSQSLCATAAMFQSLLMFPKNGPSPYIPYRCFPSLCPSPQKCFLICNFGEAGRPENKSGENRDWGTSSCNIQTRDNIWDHKPVKHLWEIWGLVNIGTCKHRDCGNIENIESGEYTDWLNIGLGSNSYLQMVLGNISGNKGTGEHANWRI